MLDTGVARVSTADYKQAEIYIREFHVSLNTTTTKSINAYFGIRFTILVDIIIINSPISRILFYIIKVETLFLLYL